MTKKVYLYDRFFVSNRNFTVEHAKIQGFTRFFFSKFLKFQVYSGLLCLNCQIQGFVVTLFLVFISISLKLKVL